MSGVRCYLVTLLILVVCTSSGPSAAEEDSLLQFVTATAEESQVVIEPPPAEAKSEGPTVDQPQPPAERPAKKNADREPSPEKSEPQTNGGAPKESGQNVDGPAPKPDGSGTQANGNAPVPQNPEPQNSGSEKKAGPQKGQTGNQDSDAASQGQGGGERRQQRAAAEGGNQGQDADAPKGKPSPPAGGKKPAALENIEQVQLQVFISEMSEQGLRDLGTNLSYSRFVRGIEQSGSLEEISTNLFNPPEVFESVALPVPQEGTMLRPENNLAGFGLTGNVINVGYGTIDFLFRGIERKSDVDIISKPELLVQNQQEASISAGGEIPYQAVEVKNNKEVLSIQWAKIGVNLTVTPEILPNDMVMLNVKELTVRELSRFDKVRGLDLPVFSERTQMGNVMVPNGRTLVVGGLISEVVRKTERRVPVLGSLPIVGMGFRSRRSEADFTTLMIFVSPTVVDVRSPSSEATSALEFWRERETDWANKERITEEFEDLQHRSGTVW